VVRIRDRVPKVNCSGVHRECTPEQTYERVRPHLGRIGIEQVVDLTGRDRLGIPVFEVVVPHPVDGASGYWGKGLTAIDAKTSAVMEAFERHAGWLPLRPTAIASYTELVAAGRTAIQPGDHNIRLHPDYHDDRPIYWVTGHDLRHDEPVLVPHGAVSYGVPAGAPPCYELTTTNGLASGNSLEEAICHGLCELLERDAVTIAEVVGDRLGVELADRGLSQREWYPLVDPDTLPGRARALAMRFREAGLDLRLRSVTSDLGIPTILASVHDGNGLHHNGFGTHPDVEIALIRAITECAQGRATDPLASGEAPPSTVDGGGTGEPAASLPSYPSDDVVTDIRLMLDRLASCGLSRVVVVDLSPPEIPVHVVRVVAPGLESWAIDRSKLGSRATAAWDRAVAGVMAG